jgi:hypothetical protein
MPRAIPTQLIVSLHEHLVTLPNNEQWIWRRGAVLDGTRLDINDVQVRIEDNWREHKLEISAKGAQSEWLIKTIMKNWREVNQPFEDKVVVTKIIVCACKKCQTATRPFEFEYEDVLAARQANASLQCNKSRTLFQASDILNGIFDENTTIVDAFLQKNKKIDTALVKLIEEGRIKEALDQLNTNDTDVIHLKHRFALLEKDKRIDTLYSNEYNKERNKIVADLLDYLSRPIDWMRGMDRKGHFGGPFDAFLSKKESIAAPTSVVTYNYYNSHVYTDSHISNVEYVSTLGISQADFQALQQQIAQLSSEKQAELKQLIETTPPPTTETEKQSIGKRIGTWLNENSEDITKEVVSATYFEVMKYLFGL